MTSTLPAIGPAIGIIKKYEGLRLQAYLCPAGILTIGYGHTGADVVRGQRIDEAEADRLLYADLRRFEAAVAEAVAVPLNDNQFSALVSLTYNIGVGNFQRSTLLKKLNARDFDGAADQFLAWTQAKGRELSGLKARRKEERALFLQKG